MKQRKNKFGNLIVQNVAVLAEVVPVGPHVVVRRSFVGGSLVGRRAVAGVARLHGGGVALGLGGLALGHEQLGSFALHGGTTRRSRGLAVAGAATATAGARGLAWCYQRRRRGHC